MIKRNVVFRTWILLDNIYLQCFYLRRRIRNIQNLLALLNMSKSTIANGSELKQTVFKLKPRTSSKLMQLLMLLAPGPGLGGGGGLSPEN